ncbi:WXG100 family type VII secretion target [Streptomyces coerulescens]|uniref:WXG100 family type VII secretion target n=1 Tax=Streptomyces coerulescens TaxID=29304 RepID=A0ABW0CUZ0_STRCD
MPANGNNVVDVEGMRAAQPYFEEAVSDVGNAHASMEGQIQTLIANWTGESRDIYVRAMNDWLTDCALIRSKLEVILEKLRENTGINSNTHEATLDAAIKIDQTMAQPGILPGF